MPVGSPPDSARGQIEALRQKLLDLTLRNRMLNYKPSKRLGVTILGEDSFALHGIVVESGRKMSFVGKPDPPKSVKGTLDDDVFGHDDEVAMAEYRLKAEEELGAFLDNAAMPVDQLDTKLNTDEFESVLQSKLRTILREASLANDELGINTLFLTLGMLEWRETDARSFRAPLLFVPVQLEKLANGTIRLSHDGSDVGPNLPLNAKLAEFNLKLPAWNDETSVLDYFSAIESTISGRQNWTVHRNEICLAFFNYEKYAMYVDLGGENWPEDRKPWMNEDIVQLFSSGYDAPESSIGDGAKIDPVRPVETAREVYDADGSQLIAMIRAADGLSIVVEGPPGTGKSQTITNIIAEAAAAGKTVLFVSAKRAALEVVKRRLDDAELGAMCLDMHDKMTNRREFYSELKKTVDRSLAVRPEDEKIARLGQLRDKLNGHSAAINEPLPEFACTPFEAMIRMARLPAESSEDREWRIEFSRLSQWKASEIDAHLPTVRALQSRLGMIGCPSQHPFWGCAIDALDPARRLDLEVEISSSLKALGEASRVGALLAGELKVDMPLTAASIGLLRQSAEYAVSAPPHQGVAVSSQLWTDARSKVAETIESVLTGRTMREKRSSQVRESIWTADLSLIGQEYGQKAGVWHRFLSGGFRTAKRAVSQHLASQIDDPTVRDIVADVQKAQSAECTILANDALMRDLFGAQWRGSDSDAEHLNLVHGWLQELHSKVHEKALPAGLLDFLAGTTDPEILDRAIKANELCQVALDAYRVVTGLLVVGASDITTQTLDDLIARTRHWHLNLGKLSEFIAYNELRKRAFDQGLSEVLRLADQWPLASARLEEAFLRSYFAGFLRLAMEQRPELRTFERHLHEASVTEFQGLDDFKLKYNRAQVRLAHHRRLPTFETAVGNLQLLRVQCGLHRAHKPIRWIMARAGEAIQRIKPVFMMSPLSVAVHLPPELPLFDMVIFDEASQVRPEDSLCAIARAKQCIVVGDTRQMPPTSFFDRVAADEDELGDDADQQAELGAEARKLESVLSLMGAMVQGRVRRPDLRWHYRSVHPSLIQPSNEMFYENRLIVFPSPSADQGGRRVGVVFRHDPSSVYEGGQGKRINLVEAQAVAKAVLEHARTYPDESLLVAAMNKSQADLIYDEVQKLERLNPDPFRAYMQRHPHEPLSIKNLENVQGDERDVVYISVTYGRDRSGVIRQQFGPLLSEGGERRLNVLITRARRRCEVFSNMSADDIRIDRPGRGVEALKKYLRFAESGELTISVATGQAEESPFEEEVSAALREFGYTVDPQVGCEGYRIDMAVLDPASPGRYLLGIECDGATYHSAQTARDRDKLRQRILEDRGWTLHRIWSYDWWQDRESEIKRLVAAIEATRESDVPPSARTTEVVPDVELVEGEQIVSAVSVPYLVTPDPEHIGTAADLEKYLVRVVSYEGPIQHDLLVTRLRAATGYGRAGTNVKRWLDGMIAAAERQGFIRRALDAYVNDDRQLVRLRDWSTSTEKKALRIPEVELEHALLHTVNTAFGIDHASASRGALNLLGFRRVSDDAISRAIAILGRMVREGKIGMKGTELRPLAK